MSKYGEPWNLIDGWTYASGEPEPVMGYSETGGVNMTVPCDEYQARIVACVNALAGIDDPAGFVGAVNMLRSAACGFMDRVSSATDKAVFSREAREIVMKSVDEIGDALAMLPPKGQS